MNRRGFLSSILAAAAAPMIVRAESLMQLAAPESFVMRASVMVPSSFAGTMRLVRAYDVNEDGWLLRLDVIGREPMGTLVQKHVSMACEIGAYDEERIVAPAIEVLVRDLQHCDITPVRGVLELPHGVYEGRML